jgi:hypothetical protein
MIMAATSASATNFGATVSGQGPIVGVMARGWSDLDWSALGRLAAWEAGLDGTAESAEPGR